LRLKNLQGGAGLNKNEMFENDVDDMEMNIEKYSMNEGLSECE
jgi:hypothetical protein